MANPFEKKSAAFWADGMECAEPDISIRST